MSVRNWVVLLCVLAFSSAAWSADIRFYKTDKRQQQSKIGLVAGTSKPGCHNFLTKRRVYRVSQVGFQHCRLFAEKDCAPDSTMQVRWKNKKRPTDKLTPGARWFLAGARGSKVGSWECVAEPQ